MINIGAYVKGSNPKIDNAIDKIDPVNALLKQQTNENIPFDETVSSLQGLFSRCLNHSKGKRFNYNLQSVLKYREIMEQQEQEKFVEKQREYEEEKRKEEEIKAFQAEKYTELREHMSSGYIDFQQLTVRKGHLEVLKDQVIEQEQKTEDSEKAKEEQREVLVQSVKERRCLIKIRKRKRSPGKLMAKEDAKFLDEIGVLDKSV